MTDEIPDVVSRARAALDGITPEKWVHYDDFLGGVHTLDDLSETDVRFALAAPDLVRDLIAEVEQLRDDLRVERITTHLCESVDADLREARAEVERLAAERDQAIAAHQRAEARATLHREERDEARAAVAREADIWHHLSLAAGGPVGTHGDAVDAIASLRRETDQAGAAELRVRLLHSPVDCRGTDEQRCQECISEPHPCPTIRAFDGEA
ncbi:hypothetical protein SAMN04488550_4173 [Gordonia malaquae]|uniref:Uncharacterized protein n=1 Tax=Gordonia malaquae NBRC 108250 TaxID=1223542 RepID=M3V015_GORML|nr:hypothetical protein [Gordonia malaquae]GAC81672.1 hypothetical protein GM1_041_00430 [Gordonia malaquae NBRC 108250]SEE26484.1 hypothetical protein SAMN04488550_4173 [Gordonia malaquae]